VTTTTHATGHEALLPHVRLYESIRTAHLERAHDLSPATILYRVKRYDFAEEAAFGLQLVQASPLRAARLLARSSVHVLEINEPLMLSSLPASAIALLAVSFRRRNRPLVVSYAIGNDDPFLLRGPTGWKTRLRRRLERFVARLVSRRIDRIAFGTSAARDVYRSVLGAPTSESALVPALPAPFPSAEPSRKRSGRVAFVGALSDRKGVAVLLEAWQIVVAQRHDASLMVVGKGPLEDLVRRAMATDTSISLEVDPPRDAIHVRLDEAVALVLPSQPSPSWREQVGLPIVEALAHGCRIVTTSETGLADWLREHGHRVSSDASSSQALAEAILASLDSGPTPTEVLASLPERDGRLAADDWLTRETGRR
jgi:glycosyltransferase involved in cell wall biosynthesis